MGAPFLALGYFIDAEDTDKGECKGSLTLLNSAGDIIEIKEDTAITKVEKATVEGCGCYRLYERKNKRGRSYYINKNGEHILPLRTVGSIALAPCSKAALAPWSVALVVAGLVLILGTGVV